MVHLALPSAELHRFPRLVIWLGEVGWAKRKSHEESKENRKQAKTLRDLASLVVLANQYVDPFGTLVVYFFSF